ncbi:hypothetical protein BCD67_19185 [Oscillatoriales cyanobacterium USR001]|nr:hypothetical protein BCD67_19185 [Oscillatoriales cyanobacterium USR001]
MDTTVLSSTFLLTLLLAVGLFFFIKASVKDRTEQVKLVSEQTPDALSTKLQEYFSRRAYHIAAVDGDRDRVTFEGFVRPSWFLAIFLTLLSAVGLLCMSLVLSMLVPASSGIFLALVLLSPLTGLFYWKKAGRSEQVALKLEGVTWEGSSNLSLITVRAHRDELAAMQKALNLKTAD